jgi:predicted alpha-1,2-mannosidase
VWNESGLMNGTTSATGIDLGGWMRFPAGTRTVHMRVGVSFVDGAGAGANLEAELPGFDFDAVRAAAVDTWRKELGVLTVEGSSERDATLIATSLYRAKLMPSLMSDTDGRYRDAAGDIATAEHMRYSDFSLWDTYRTLHPWLLFSEDARNRDFVESLLAFADVAGAFPRWQLAHGDIKSMVGTPTDFVLTESALKGIEFDEARAFTYAKATAYGPAPGQAGGRNAPNDYIDYGYVPDDLHGGSVSMTLEYASADYALSMWADRLGDTTTASDLLARSSSWKAHWHAESGFLRPLDSNGQWVRWLSPTQEHEGYVEGTAWQYLWMIPHDLDGLAEILGGREAALTKLRTFFEESENETPSLGLRLYYWHGNEPDIIAPWIFAAWGRPAESVRWIDWIVREHYGLGADGLPGNDDGGTLSAWLLFAASGIYPIAGTDRYIVAAPRQRLMIVHRPGGDLRIEASADPATHPVPVQVTLDGVPIEGNELLHEQLVGAHTLRFEMAAE